MQKPSGSGWANEEGAANKAAHVQYPAQAGMPIPSAAGAGGASRLLSLKVYPFAIGRYGLSSTGPLIGYFNRANAGYRIGQAYP